MKNIEIIWTEFIGENRYYEPTDHWKAIIGRQYETTWQDFRDFILEKYYIKDEEKKKAKAIIPCSFQHEIFCKKIEGKILKQGVNTDLYYMLPLDVDGLCSIEKFNELLFNMDLTFVAHTSKNHKGPEKGYQDCFRVYIPLKEPVLHSEIALRKKTLLATFNNVLDDTGFSNSRHFSQPCLSWQCQPPITWFNNGECFDLLSIEHDPQIIYECSEKKFRENDDEFKNKVFEHLKLLPDLHYKEWMEIAPALRNEGFTFNDFCEISYNTQGNHRERWEYHWNSTKSYRHDIGYLINLCKKYLGDDIFNVKKQNLKKQGNKIKLQQEKLKNETRK